jgi:hypothetical protein
VRPIQLRFLAAGPRFDRQEVRLWIRVNAAGASRVY